jgi:putative hemolysin
LISFYIEIVGIALCLAFLFFLSLVEAAVVQSSPLVLRMMLERDEESHPALLPLVLDDRLQLLVPLHLGTQISLITIAILTTHLSLQEWPTWGVACSFGIISLISLAFRQLLPRLFTQHEPESKLIKMLAAFGPLYGLLRSLALPLSGVLTLFRRLQERTGATSGPAGEEAKDEEIQAYLDIGEDEGIIQEEDSKLIQSVVEFGNTLVRSVMTPRTKIVACDESATLAELRDVMVRNRHSRVPIYRGDMDHIVGIAYIRQLLACYSTGRELDSISGLIHPALFVPETKPVADLLKELQERGDHIAMVIDEYGGVSGLVSMEDLLEEIVGEIRDEDQAQVSEIVEEAPGRYAMRGGTEIHRLEELIERKLESTGSSTVAGLIVTFLGRVPSPGEEFDLEGLQIQILEADRRRVHKVRVLLKPVVM